MSDSPIVVNNEADPISPFMRFIPPSEWFLTIRNSGSNVTEQLLYCAYHTRLRSSEKQLAPRSVPIKKSIATQDAVLWYGRSLRLPSLQKLIHLSEKKVEK